MNGDTSKYSFLPWVRRGISNNITSNPDGKSRVELDVKLTFNDTEVTNTIQLIGPGDIIGINSNEIVRTEPKNWITDFEPNYLAFIEFYDEDFPWRYSPIKNEAEDDKRLLPWLYLLILKENEFERTTVSSRPLPSIKLTGNPEDVFPDFTQTWAWAHVHVNTAINSAEPEDLSSSVDALIETNPDIALSRLCSPRKLEEKTAYYAFLIPAFETGRMAGLGQDVPDETDGTEGSWSLEDVPGTEYPVYYEWFFRTGINGDFEYLVGLLEAKEMDSSIGIRDMDIHEPGFYLDELSDKAILGLEGALKAPSTLSKGYDVKSDKGKFESQIKDIINLQETYKETGVTADEQPVISPPLYGQWHALVDTLTIKEEDVNWINNLNKDPRNRAAAGLGAKVIRKHQDKYVRIAWEEVGEILEANQKINYTQLAMEVSRAMYSKNILGMDTDAFLQVTAPVHSKILGSKTTIYKQIKDSSLPTASMNSAFRKVIRPYGNLMQNLGIAGFQVNKNIVTMLNLGTISAGSPKTTPAKIFSTGVIVRRITTDKTLLEKNPGLASMAASLYLKKMTESEIERIPANPSFVVTNPGEVYDHSTGTKDSTESANFRAAMSGFIGYLQAPVEEVVIKSPFDITNAVSKIKTALDPALSFTKKILGSITIGGKALESFTPVMAYPDIKQPMYEPLRNMSSEYLIPNLNLIPQNCISLLETNQPFIEAYMVGLNHEFARELLWREYPTDQRGSYFRQFWDTSGYIDTEGLSEEELAEKLKDIDPIHEWQANTDLGYHNNRDEGVVSDSQLVLVIRGDLLKKYPNTIIFAQKAKWKDDKAELEIDDSAEENILYPLYSATISPDLTFLGFDLTVEEAKGDVQSEGEKEKERVADDETGWFFILQEVPGEPRFGLDVKDSDTPTVPTTWDMLAWEHLDDDTKCINVEDEFVTKLDNEEDKAISWGSNSADMAYILYQKPVMVAVHAREMLYD